MLFSKHVFCLSKISSHLLYRVILASTSQKSVRRTQRRNHHHPSSTSCEQSRSPTPRILRCYGIYQQDMAQHKDMMPYNGPIWQNLMDGFEFLGCQKHAAKVEESGDPAYFSRHENKNTGVHETNKHGGGGGETRISILAK